MGNNHTRRVGILRIASRLPNILFKIQRFIKCNGVRKEHLTTHQNKAILRRHPQHISIFKQYLVPFNSLGNEYLARRFDFLSAVDPLQNQFRLFLAQARLIASA